MVARAIWTGIISFGMVSIPVKLYSATESKSIAFHQLHNQCKSRIREIRWCPVCEKKVEWEELEKGYEYSKGKYIVLSEDELAKLPLPSKDTVEISAFVKAKEIDPIYHDRSYFLEPDKAALRPYTLFMKALLRKGMVAIGKLTFRTKERLCALRPSDGTLMLDALLYPDEIRVESKKPLPDVNITKRELDMANSLVDLMSQKFEPEQYKDQYREALVQLIEAKLEGEEIITEAAPAGPKVVDLMEALHASLEKAKMAPPSSLQKIDGKRTKIVKAAPIKTRARENNITGRKERTAKQRSKRRGAA